MIRVVHLVPCPSGYAILDDDVPIVEGLTAMQAYMVAYGKKPGGKPLRVSHTIPWAAYHPRGDSEYRKYQARALEEGW